MSVEIPLMMCWQQPSPPLSTVHHCWILTNTHNKLDKGTVQPGSYTACSTSTFSLVYLHTLPFYQINSSSV